MQTNNSKLKTKRECDVAYTTLNRLYKLCDDYTTLDEIKFAIMCMKTQIKETAELIEIEELRHEIWYFNKRVEDLMKCRNGPCHKCHHLFNGCYEPRQEYVDEIKRRYEVLENGTGQI